MTERTSSKPGFGRVAIAIVAICAAIFAISKTSKTQQVASQSAKKTETYRLIHALGNSENEAARGLSKTECERRKQDLKVVSTSLGTYNEATGYGSITCLPESSF